MTDPGTSYTIEPWAVSEHRLNLDRLARTESVFALCNGHIGLRANLDEGEPHGVPGTYLAGFHESRALPYAERGFADPEMGETVVNVTDGKIIRLLVDDEPFDVRYGTLLRHERTLDFRRGWLRRTVEWESPAGARVRIISTRLVSFVQRAVAAVCWEVEPLGAGIRVVVQSELVANEPLPEKSTPDPRDADALSEVLVAEGGDNSDTSAVLVHVTKQSGLRIAAGMDHLVDGPRPIGVTMERQPDVARLTVSTELGPGERLRVVKLLGYAWSSQRSLPAVRAQASAALAEARHAGWNGLANTQRNYLDEFWENADVEIDGDAELQQALRFSLFQVLQAGARGEGRAIAAKGLTGSGYDGHAFWDTETFVLHVLTYTQPSAAAHALRWRHSTLPQAKARAAVLGLRGAAFAWRTITGEECSGYWPAGTAGFHVNADIADAVLRYQAAASDPNFERTCGLEVLVETARLWRSLGHHGEAGNFRIDGVTGPDEYSAVADNNVFTNLMAERNLAGAADLAERYPNEARAFGVDAEETASWRDAARRMTVPYDHAHGVHPQAEEFIEHQRWDFAQTSPEKYPLLLHFPYFELYRKQVLKQADVVLALHLRGDRFSPEEKARNFAYYEALTVRDSSLSACTQAVIAAEVGQLDLAYDYFAEAALVDLSDLHENTDDGLHVASLAGAWIAAVAGFGGMRDHGGQLAFSPRLARPLTRLSFRMRFKGCCLHVEATPEAATYRLISGRRLEVSHHGEPLSVTAELVRRAIPTLGPVAPRPVQPEGRAPRLRRRGGYA